jgi:hypothetical protein
MKALIIGVVVAAAAGVAAGDAMRPVLAVAPPPMQAASATAPSAYADAAGVWDGKGPVPDYVIGADWTRGDTAPVVSPDVTWPEMDAPAAELESAAPAAEARPDEPAPQPSSYPSEQGDILAGVHRAPPPDESPPEPPSA